MRLALVLCAALLALPAAASAAPSTRDVLVLSEDGRTRVRPTPFSGPLDLPGAAGRAPAPPRARARAAARKTVSSELARLRDSGALDAARYDELRATYAAARSAAGRLSGTRRSELQAVVRTVEDIARRGQLSLSRLGPLFLTLERNREWWTTGAAARQRAADRVRGLRARVAVLRGPGAPAPAAGQLRQAQRLLDRRAALQRPHGGDDGRAAAAGGQPRRRRGVGVLLHLRRRAPAVGERDGPGDRRAGAGAGGDPARAPGRRLPGRPEGAGPVPPGAAHRRAGGERRRRALPPLLLRPPPVRAQRLHPGADRPARLRDPDAATRPARRCSPRATAAAGARPRPSTPARGRCTRAGA